MIPEVTVADLLTLVGLTPIVMVFVEAVKRLLTLNDAAIQRFGPVLSIGSGILLAEAAAGWLISQGTAVDIGQAALTGAVAGALSAGLYDVVGERAGQLIERVTGGRIT
jgi:hypothetical protein